MDTEETGNKMKIVHLDNTEVVCRTEVVCPV